MDSVLTGIDGEVRYADTFPYSSLNVAEQRELASRMERKQMKEFMTVCIYPTVWRQKKKKKGTIDF